MKNKNLPKIISDIEEAWDSTSKWAIPMAFFTIAIIVAFEVVKKRTRRI